MKQEDYAGRTQTLVKHFILHHYLERFAHIVGHRWDSITYVDGFAGPWNVRSPDLQDSSFAIALAELRKARATHQGLGKPLRLRCFFLEENRSAYRQLEGFAEGVKDAEVRVLNGSFEESVDSILEFIRKGGRGTFPFIFIDPTGWTGFARKLISPLLKLDPGEVLINFMTGHIRRFLRDENSQRSFEDLFGSAEILERVAGLTGQEFDDALVSEYSRVLAQEGQFQYVLPAIVLHPEIDRTHFHLIYATRHPKGVEVFKKTEQAAMQEMEKLRAEVQKRRHEERTGQLFLSSAEAGPSPHYNQLRDRYLAAARHRILGILKRRRRLSYDEAWASALESPLVWESDLKDWIQDWQSTKSVRLEGLQGRERVPKRGYPHFLLWQE